MSSNNFDAARYALRAAALLTTCITLFASSTCIAAYAQQSGLPPTSLDSFVYEAGGSAEQIYGDEGVDDIPPYFEFTPEHRINTGITGVRDQGLTTGHGSLNSKPVGLMPSAWGADEFLAPPGEWSISGANGGNLGYNNAGAAGNDLSGLEQAVTNAEQQVAAAADAVFQLQSQLAAAQAANAPQAVIAALQNQLTAAQQAQTAANNALTAAQSRFEAAAGSAE